MFFSYFIILSFSFSYRLLSAFSNRDDGNGENLARKIPEKYLKKYLRKITREQAKLETKQDKNNANDKKAV